MFKIFTHLGTKLTDRNNVHEEIWKVIKFCKYLLLVLCRLEDQDIFQNNSAGLFVWLENVITNFWSMNKNELH
jgi:hypothetical protein